MPWKYAVLDVNEDGSPEGFEEPDKERKKLDGPGGRPETSLVDALNAIGQDNWELIAIVGREGGTTLIFKCQGKATLPVAEGQDWKPVKYGQPIADDED